MGTLVFSFVLAIIMVRPPVVDDAPWRAHRAQRFPGSARDTHAEPPECTYTCFWISVVLFALRILVKSPPGHAAPKPFGKHTWVFS